MAIQTAKTTANQSKFAANAAFKPQLLADDGKHALVYLARKAKLAQERQVKRYFAMSRAERLFELGKTPFKGTPTAPDATVELPIPPTPVISSVSVSEGTPGDPVLITGSGFTNRTRVLFLVAPGGRREEAPIERVTATQIFCYVPDALGVATPFRGYVAAANASESEMVPFRFLPALELKWLCLVNWSGSIHEIRDGADVRREFSLTDDYGGHRQMVVGHGPENPHRGARGHDELNGDLRLANGWLVDAVWFDVYSDVAADASFVSSDAGSDSLRFGAHWWFDGLAFDGQRATRLRVYYRFYYTVKGPMGTRPVVVDRNSNSIVESSSG